MEPSDPKSDSQRFWKKVFKFFHNTKPEERKPVRYTFQLVESKSSKVKMSGRAPSDSARKRWQELFQKYLESVGKSSSSGSENLQDDKASTINVLVIDLTTEDPVTEVKHEVE